MLVAHADATIYPVIFQYFFPYDVFFGIVFYSHSLCTLLHETVYPRKIDGEGGTYREREKKQTNEQQRKCFRSIMVVFCFIRRWYTNNIKWQGYKKVYTHAISKIKQKIKTTQKIQRTNRRDENEKWTKEMKKKQNFFEKCLNLKWKRWKTRVKILSRILADAKSFLFGQEDEKNKRNVVKQKLIRFEFMISCLGS